MTTTKTFTIGNVETNCNWVIKNLDDRDYQVTDAGIVITYFSEDQKKDILEAIENA